MAVKIADFIEAPNSGGTYKKVLLVVHLTISPEVKGAARGVVAFWIRGRSGSTQYVVDAAEIIQAVRETAYAWSAGTTANKWGIHVEHCGMLQSVRQWRDGYSTAELDLSAQLFADLAAKYAIPVRWLTVEEIRHAVKTGRPEDGGFCTHADITKAFPGETTHTDPGLYFPKTRWIGQVKAAGKPAAPAKPDPKTPKPAPATVPFQAISHNIRHALPASDVKATLDRLTASTADVLALQEMSGRRALLVRPGWEDVLVDMPEVKGESANVLLVRSSEFVVKREEVVQVTDKAVVPARAAGPTHLGAYYFTHAPLLHKASRRTVHAVSVHMPASQQIKQMRALADEAATRLAAYLKPLSGQFVVLGDWNTQTPLDLGGGALRKLGFKSDRDDLGPLPTLGNRGIDQALYRGPDLTPVSHRTIPGLPSDHLPLLVRFNLTVKES